ncbi:hypothetical protein Psuf_039700 [Phytohabitans suffuscus]|uniref:Uncharacterized protein n=1 Tax=Phytohabitans suffuscus TaxID=624315 RepID=A0A6F8YKQ3_9ACTN|nr:hypothetical protein Psuf_039700 [Phytohabitans suffuscus]
MGAGAVVGDDLQPGAALEGDRAHLRADHRGDLAPPPAGGDGPGEPRVQQQRPHLGERVVKRAHHVTKRIR